MARRITSSIVWFLAPLLIAAVSLQRAVEWRLGAARDGEIGKINGILAGELAPPLSLWGASTVHIQLDPEIIGTRTGLPAYNFGLTGNAFWQYRGLLENYLSNSEEARIAVVALNVLEFEKRDAIYLVHQWLHHLEIAPVYSALLSTDPQLWKSKHIPFYRLTVYDRHVLDLVRADVGKAFGRTKVTESVESERLGFVPDASPWQLGEAVTYENHRIAVDRQVARELVRIAAIGKKRGIDVEIVLLPCFAPYRQSIDNLNEVRAELDYLSDRGLDPIDLLSDDICEDQGFWRDRHHVNAAGAAALSAKLADRLVERMQKKGHL